MTTKINFNQIKGAVFNVADSGVLGNGTDESVTIQTAVTAAAGNMLVFPPTATGYKTTVPITVPAGTVLDGQGAVFTNLLTDMFSLDSVANIEIRGFRFVGASPVTTGGIGQYAIRATNTTAPCTYISVHDNVCSQINLFSNFSDLHTPGGAYYYDWYRTPANVAHNFSIKDNMGQVTTAVVTTADRFIFVQFAKQVTISGNECQGFTGGIEYWNGDWNKAGFDVTLDRIGADCVITGNTVVGGSAGGSFGIAIESVKGTAISGNAVRNCDGESLDVESSSNVIVSGNSVENGSKCLTTFNSCDNVLFASNTITVATNGEAYSTGGWASSGTQSISSSGLVSFKNNTITGDRSSTTSATLALGFPNSMEFVGNTFTDCFWPGSNVCNTFVFSDNTLIYTSVPQLAGVNAPWCMGLPNPSLGVGNLWTRNEVTPVFTILGNRIVNKTATNLSTTGFNVPTSSIAAARFLFKGNVIESTLGINIAAGGAIARHITVHDNSIISFQVNASTPTTPLSYISGTGDEVHWLRNSSPRGEDCFNASSAATPSSTQLTAAGAVPWVFSRIDSIQPTTGQFIGWTWNGTAWKTYGVVS
jgi:hypothetical protein